jgi:hypothetical protein
MKLFKSFMDAAQYLSEGIGRIFSPRDDQYPDIGVQPFEGEPYSEWIELENKR